MSKEPSDKTTRQRSWVAHRALVTLLRKVLAGRWGIRAARIYAAMLGISMIATIWVVSSQNGADDTAMSLLARAVGLLTWIAGGIAALSLASPPKDPALAESVAALASAHGVTEDAFARAEVAATVRLLVEVIVVPTFAIGAFVLVFVLGHPVAGTGWSILGAVAFGLVASMVLGVVASACRRWGGGHGRRWLMGVVLLPWVVAELLVDGRASAYLSIPGLLGRAWDALAAVGL